MTKFFKNTSKKAIKVEEKPPRDIKDIQADYAKLTQQAGHVQYQIYALGQTLELMNKDMLNLNREGDARNKADEAAKKTAETAQEVVNAQS